MSFTALSNRALFVAGIEGQYKLFTVQTYLKCVGEKNSEEFFCGPETLIVFGYKVVHFETPSRILRRVFVTFYVKC